MSTGYLTREQSTLHYLTFQKVDWIDVFTRQIYRESRKYLILNRFQFNTQQHSRNENYQMWTHDNHAEVIYSLDFAR